MKLQPLWLFSAVASLVLLAGCGKKTDTSAGAAPGGSASGTALPIVKATERSKHFNAVAQQLEVGGTLYGYVDIDGDVLKLTGGLKSILAEVARNQPQAAIVAQQDLDALANKLGLTDIKALGVSSVPEGDGFFRNRAFFYTGGERHGLMAAFGGKPGPLKHIGLAPANASLYSEAEIDMAAVYQTLKSVIAQVAGEPAGNQMEAALKQAGQQAAISFLDLIYGLKGRSALVLRLDPEKPFRFPSPQPVVLPGISLVICVDGIGQVVEPSLSGAPGLKRSEQGTAHVYEMAQQLPIEGLQPAIVIDGTQLYLTTSLAFLKECREQKSGLAQDAAFQKALAQVGAENNGITYLSPALFDQIRAMEPLNPDLPPDSKAVFSYVLNNLPKSDRPQIVARINRDDGILIRGYMNRSFKQEVVAAAFYNPVTLGLVAAMAVPAFQKVRTASQEKAVMNNLRQLSAAAEQYYVENNVRSVTLDRLVGPGRLIRALTPVAGENYRNVILQQGTPLRVTLPGGKVVEFAP